MMQGKKDVPFWEAFQGAFHVYTIAALANGLFNGLATGLFGDKDKEDLICFVGMVQKWEVLLLYLKH